MTPDLFTAATARATSSPPKPSTAKRGKRIAFNVTEGEDVRTIYPAGRDAWALASMLSAGVSGCTPIDHVGPRWSHYIWKLRTVYGLAIESVEEQHGGEFSGRHVRYVLRSRVVFADPADAARHGAAK
jgi:hypothetical protein